MATINTNDIDIAESLLIPVGSMDFKLPIKTACEKPPVKEDDKP